MILEKLKAFSKDTLYYGMSSVLSRVVGFLLVPLYTQFLSPSDYGIMTLLGFYTLFFSPISHLGLQGAMFRYVGMAKTEQEEGIIITSVFKVILVNSIIFTIASILLIKPLEIFLLKSQDYTTLLYLTIIASFFSSLAQLLISFLRIKRKVKNIFYLNLFKILFGVFLSIYLIAQLGLGIAGAIQSLFITSIVNFILVILVVKFPIKNKLDLVYIKKMLNYGLPNLPKYLQAIIMMLFGQYYLSETLSVEDLGYYAIAWKFCLPLVVLYTVIGTSWNAYKFDLLKDKNTSREVFSQFSNYKIIAYSIVFLLICLWGAEALILLTAEEFHNASRFVPYLALIPLFTALYQAVSTYISFGDKQVLNPFIGTTGLLITVSMSFLLIPKYSIIGAGVATALGWLGMAIFGYLYGQSMFKVNFRLPQNILLICLVIFSGLYLVDYVNKFVVFSVNMVVVVIRLNIISRMKYVNA
jgi:O-antigen/teichoic acid export membrane protein